MIIRRIKAKPNQKNYTKKPMQKKHRELALFCEYRFDFTEKSGLACVQ